MKDQNNQQKESSRGRIFGKIPVLSFIGVIVGLIGGYIYYIQVGCQSGSCAITSNPYLSMAWGGAIGYLGFDMFTKKSK